MAGRSLATWPAGNFAVEMKPRRMRSTAECGVKIDMNKVQGIDVRRWKVNNASPCIDLFSSMRMSLDPFETTRWTFVIATLTRQC